MSLFDFNSAGTCIFLYLNKLESPSFEKKMLDLVLWQKKKNSEKNLTNKWIVGHTIQVRNKYAQSMNTFVQSYDCNVMLM